MPRILIALFKQTRDRESETLGIHPDDITTKDTALEMRVMGFHICISVRPYLRLFSRERTRDSNPPP